MQPIRVLNLFTIMNRGGAETMVMNLYRQIDRTKIQFDFMVYYQERGSYDDEIESMGGKIYRMPKLRFLNLYRYTKCLKTFFYEHKEYKILHGHMGETGFFVYREASRQGVPIIIVHSHCANSPIKGIQIHARIKKMIKITFEQLMWRYVTDGFACGYAARDALFGSKSKPAIILNNAIDTEKFVYNSQIAYEVKTKLGIKNKFVIGHVGRMDVNKNQWFIVDIFKCIHDKNPDTVLLLIGDGELKRKIASKIKKLNLNDSVILTGVRSDIPNLMQAIDVFLFPSLYEGVPVAVIEAQAAGLPCILSDAISKETNIVGQCQFISLNKPPHEWAKIVLKYERGFKRKDMQVEFGKAGYDIKTTAKWLEEYYLKKYVELKDMK
ncbi:glycosyltransferase family 1 protein [Sporomusa acidovorans]|uniref:Glycosyltransferase EpsF n=1 Tax=Sporomusa acidovorans (strain ATCC 49682 / DSM 3132 / Mol) TaxID=1123286 RepID=A0ABZ3IYK4_SPOA4|nr:glycosyltransferase family 1 protein [Sporomusa acidovorans]OZC17241.1 putative glycosyltransferase EpsF [Sporomusa acidovorans DSM 3132]SDF15488.1 Glycosyltransferase involved in cell wall bisynthesis [Sporomusa acidovorans]